MRKLSRISPLELAPPLLETFFSSPVSPRSGTRSGGVKKGGCGFPDLHFRSAAWNRKKRSHWTRWSIRGVMPLPGPLYQTPTNAIQHHLHSRRRRRHHETDDSNNKMTIITNRMS